MKSKYLSRKLIAFIVNDVILTGVVLIILFKDSAVLTTPVMVAFMTLIVLNGITYIGGKALEVWAKSKYFHAELVESA